MYERNNELLNEDAVRASTRSYVVRLTVDIIAKCTERFINAMERS